MYISAAKVDVGTAYLGVPLTRQVRMINLSNLEASYRLVPPVVRRSGGGDDGGGGNSRGCGGCVAVVAVVVVLAAVVVGVELVVVVAVVELCFASESVAQEDFESGS